MRAKRSRWSSRNSALRSTRPAAPPCSARCSARNRCCCSRLRISCIDESAPAYSRSAPLLWGSAHRFGVAPGAMPMVIVMAPQQIGREIMPGIVPDRMDVIGLVLGVVVLDQQIRALQPVIMRPSRLDAAGPGEMDVFEPGLAEPGPLGLRPGGAHGADAVLDQPHW